MTTSRTIILIDKILIIFCKVEANVEIKIYYQNDLKLKYKILNEFLKIMGLN